MRPFADQNWRGARSRAPERQRREKEAQRGAVRLDLFRIPVELRARGLRIGSLTTHPCRDSFQATETALGATTLSADPHARIRSRRGSLNTKERCVTSVLNPSRLAFLVPDLEGGGVQRMTLLIARGLAERGHDITLVLYTDDGPLAPMIPASARRVRIQPSSPTSARLK